jgi:cephalosporin hydroxylase
MTTVHGTVCDEATARQTFQKIDDVADLYLDVLMRRGSVLQGGMRRLKQLSIASTARRVVWNVMSQPRIEQAIIDAFHVLYFGRVGENGQRAWEATTWRGVPMLKNPLDLWTYQEMLYDLRPDVVIEAGTSRGGSAFYLASILDMIGSGVVRTIDVEQWPNLPEHPRIEYTFGSSTAPEIFAHVTRGIGPDSSVLVVLDSDHSMRHVLDELRLYSPIVPLGSYIVVEDSNFNGHPVARDFGPGPMEAINAFLAETSEFVSDPRRERHLVSFNPRGYLKRVREGATR